MITPKRYGVIDLGTNTFHLLIIDKEDSSYKTVYRERVYVRLGQGGVDEINEEAFERGLNCLEQFRFKLKEYECTNFTCVGTAALRKSSNAGHFIHSVKEKTGISIEVISGSKEAYYIFKGIESAFEFKESYSLIMDIGGGSVEYIITNKNGFVYTQSIPMGIAILKNNFHHSDPMSASEQTALKKFFFDKTVDLRNTIAEFKPQELIGASGTFDLLSEQLEKTIVNQYISKIDLNAFNQFSEKVLAYSKNQLLKWDAVPDPRVDLISVAIQLINLTLEVSQIENILSSKHALKEGLINEALG